MPGARRGQDDEPELATRVELTSPTVLDSRSDLHTSLRRSSRPPAPLTLDPGAIVAGRYRVVRPIAAGGYGEVLEVVDERTGRAIALKLHRRAARSPWAAASLRGEFAILASLHHPSLADVLDFGYAGDAAYFTQALVPGVRLDRAGLDLSSESALELLAQLCRALDYLHARGLLHRDVKPANVLVDLERERLVLLDFGIARAFGHADGRLVVGTHAYLSPEAIRGQPLDPRSDLYSLGVTLYRLAAGHLPFSSIGRAGDDVLWDHLTIPPPPLPEHVPRPIAAVIGRLLEKEPAARFASASEVLDALGRAIGRDVAHDTPDTLASYVLSAKYVETEGQLAQLWEHVGAACPLPPLALVGEAGTGKSRTLRELRHEAQFRGTAWIAVSARHDDPSLGVLRDIAEAAITADVAAAMEDDDRLELARGVPSLRRRGERIAIPVDPERSRRLRIEALGRALALRFHTRPGVVVVEDLHRAESSVASALASLAHAMAAAGARCSVVVSARPGATVAELASATGAREVRAEPLSPVASRALVASTFGRGDLLEGTALGRALAGAAHPALWVQESLRWAVEQGRIVRRGGQFHVAGEVPALAAEAVLAARLAGLPDGARHVALACAVWGGPGSAGEIARVAGGSLRRAGAGLRELVRAGVVEEARDSHDRATYAMHDRFADVVRSVFPSGHAQAMHQRAARALLRSATHAAGGGDPHAIGAAAAHLLESGDAAAARETFVSAARVAERGGRPDLALRFVDRALATGAASPAASIALQLFRHDLATTCAERASAEASLAWLHRNRARAAPGEQVAILLRRAKRVATGGDGGGARRMARTALGLAQQHRDARAQIQARLVAGDIEWLCGSMDVALAEFRAAAALALATADREAEARAWLGASLSSLHLGRRGEALETARRATKASAGSTDLALRSEALRQLGNVTRELGRNRRALAHYQHAVRVARACGCLEREAKALNNLGTVGHWLGDVEGAMEAYRRSISLKERAGATVSAIVGHNNVGALQLSIGQHDQARATLEPLIEADGVEWLTVRIIALSNLGDLDACEGLLDRAIERHSDALESCRARSFGTMLSHSLTSLARVLLMRAAPGDLDRATALTAELGTLATELDIAEARRRWHATRAVLADFQGDGASAIEQAKLAVGARDRMTRFSDLFATPVEVRWVLALVLAHAGRERASLRAASAVRRELLHLAALLPEGEVRDGFLQRHPLHRAILATDLHLPRGWTWSPPSHAP